MNEVHHDTTVVLFAHLKLTLNAKFFSVVAGTFPEGSQLEDHRVLKPDAMLINDTILPARVSLGMQLWASLTTTSFQRSEGHTLQPGGGKLWIS